MHRGRRAGGHGGSWGAPPASRCALPARGFLDAPDTRNTILTVLMTAGTFGRQGMCGGGSKMVEGRVNSPIRLRQRKPCDVRALRKNFNTTTYYLSILFYSTLLYTGNKIK